MINTLVPGPHEIRGHLIFVKHGLKPYFGLDSITKSFGGGTTNQTFEFQGQTWSVSLGNSPSGFAPRDDDDFDLEEVREFDLTVKMLDDLEKKKVSYNVSPRWPNMRTKDGKDADQPNIEGVDLHFQGANIEVDNYLVLLKRAAEAIGLNTWYFDVPSQRSNIYQFERYVRIKREIARKLIKRGGTLEQIFDCVGEGDGSYRALVQDDTEIEGYMHRTVADSDGSAHLINSHVLGKQWKHYHPEVPRKEPNDPLYHPKFGVLFRSNRTTGGSIPWEDRHQIRNELDESIINALSWTGLPTEPDGETFVEDAYWNPTNDELPIEIVDDPTPEIREHQTNMVDAQLVGLAESDEDVIEAITDGGTEVETIADKTNWSTRTVYRVVERLGDILNVQSGEIGFESNWIEEMVTDKIKSLKDSIKQDQRACPSAWARWKTKHGVKVSDRDARLLFRFGELPDQINIDEIIREGLYYWRKAGKDSERYENAKFKINGVTQVAMSQSSRKSGIFN